MLTSSSCAPPKGSRTCERCQLIDELERWVSVEVVAAHLGVARDSVYRWIEGRGLPAHRIGRLLKFKLSEVDAWVRRNEGASQDLDGLEKP